MGKKPKCKLPIIKGIVFLTPDIKKDLGIENVKAEIALIDENNVLHFDK